MSDVECPDCGYEQNINHDGDYSESETYSHQCKACKSIFAYSISIHISYEVESAACLNDDDAPHKFNQYGWCACGAYLEEKPNTPIEVKSNDCD